MISKIKLQIKIIYRKFLTCINLPFYYILGQNKRDKILWEGLHNRYLGKRCFIINNGPSLRAADLDKIHQNGDFSLGINIISRIYPQTKWRPNILLVTEDGAYKRKNKSLVSNCEAGLKVLKNTNFLRSAFFKGNKVYVKLKESRCLLDFPKFSVDASKFLYSIGTSTYSTIEIAYYLGFREIYIIGCDMSWAVNMNRDGSIYYNESGQNHFYGKDKDVQSNVVPNPTWEFKAAFAAAEKFSYQYGFRIYNATRGGCCEEFERVDFDTLFNK